MAADAEAAIQHETALLFAGRVTGQAVDLAFSSGIDWLNIVVDLREARSRRGQEQEDHNGNCQR